MLMSTTTLTFVIAVTSLCLTVCVRPSGGAAGAQGPRLPPHNDTQSFLSSSQPSPSSLSSLSSSSSSLSSASLSSSNSSEMPSSEMFSGSSKTVKATSSRDLQGSSMLSPQEDKMRREAISHLRYNARHANNRTFNQRKSGNRNSRLKTDTSRESQFPMHGSVPREESASLGSIEGGWDSTWNSSQLQTNDMWSRDTSMSEMSRDMSMSEMSRDMSMSEMSRDMSVADTSEMSADRGWRNGKEDRRRPGFWQEDIQVGCRELRARRYISDGFCTSEDAIKEVVCAGHCLPIRDLPWYAEFVKVLSNKKLRDYQCVEDVVKKKKVTLLCQNGKKKTYRIKVVKSCKCKKITNVHNRTSRKTKKRRKKNKRRKRRKGERRRDRKNKSSKGS